MRISGRSNSSVMEHPLLQVRGRLPRVTAALPKHLSVLLLATVLFIGLRPPSAWSAVVLDTYPASGNLWKPIAISLPFTVPSGTPIITDIDLAVRGSTSPVEVGILGDQGGLPSGSFIVSQTVTPDIASDLFLSGLSWSVPVHAPLWLAVIESPDFSFGEGYWQGNAFLSQPWAFKATLDGPWFGASQQTPAARITAIPEPASILLIVSGILGLGLSWVLVKSRRLQRQRP